MKKLILGLAISLLFANIASAQIDTSIEQVQVLDAKIAIQADSSVNIIENISYNFPASRHGIFRDIPYKYTRNEINYKLDISNVSVTDFNGNSYPFTTSKQSGNFEIKIGDPDKLVSGNVNYRISYTVRGAINYFSDHDEFYWNVVGSHWTVPVFGVSADVKLPPGGTTKTATAECYQGPIGSQSKCLSINTYGDSYSLVGGGVLPGQDFTVVVGWPKGLVTEPTTGDKIWKAFRDNVIFFLPIVALFAMWWAWYRYGRDPKSKLPVVAQYEAPDNLNPAEIGYLASEKKSNTLVSAEIIYLATKGYLRIERIPKQGLFGSENFKFIRLKPEADLPEFDRNIMAKLFADGTESLLSDFKKKGKATSNAFGMGNLPKNLTQKGYFDKNPETVRLKYMVTGGVLLAVLFYFFVNIFGVSLLISLIGTLLVVMAFGYFMPRKTQKGADTKNLILGLKEYLSVAEKDRLDFHNDPEKDPQIFEKLLPYAIALGVSDAWAKKFAGLSEYRPTWYSDPTSTYFNFVVFNHSLNSFNSSFTKTMAASAAASGRSGLDGGGFSGGGFGGGGGGSW